MSGNRGRESSPPLRGPRAWLWTGTRARILAGRLAGNLGGPRLGEWHFIRAWRHDQADPDKVKLILGAVPDIWAEQFVANPKKDLAEYGLKDPEQRIQVTRTGENGAALTWPLGEAMHQAC